MVGSKLPRRRMINTRVTEHSTSKNVRAQIVFYIQWYSSQYSMGYSSEVSECFLIKKDLQMSIKDGLLIRPSEVFDYFSVGWFQVLCVTLRHYRICNADLTQ